MGAVCTILEVDSTIWEPHALCLDHARAMCTMLEPCVPSGSHVGARWCHMGGEWHHMGAAWLQMGPYGSGACCMGATCAIWEPDGAIWEVHAAIQELHAAHRAIWELCVPYGRQMALHESCIHCVRATWELALYGSSGHLMGAR
jgi:hypothetical protein